MQRSVLRAAGAVVYRHAPRGVRLLVVGHDDRWDFPSGPFPGEGESFASARRTVAALTGIDDLEYPLGADGYRDTLPTADGSIARYFLADAGGEAGATDAADGDDADAALERHWVSPDDAEGLLPPRLAIVLDWALARIASL